MRPKMVDDKLLTIKIFNNTCYSTAVAVSLYIQVNLLIAFQRGQWRWPRIHWRRVISSSGNSRSWCCLLSVSADCDADLVLPSATTGVDMYRLTIGYDPPEAMTPPIGKVLCERSTTKARQSTSYLVLYILGLDAADWRRDTITDRHHWVSATCVSMSFRAPACERCTAAVFKLGSTDQRGSATGSHGVRERIPKSSNCLHGF